MVKIQVIHSDEEKHSLSQDLANVLDSESEEFTDTIVECSEKDEVKTLKAHSFLIRIRSPKLGMQLRKHKDETNQVSFVVVVTL